MKKIIAYIMIFTLIISSSSFTAFSEGSFFKDVHNHNWFASAVQFAYDQQLMEGVGENKFAPNVTVNRAMVAMVLYRLDNASVVYEEPYFSDVAKNAWYFNAVEYCREKGILKGVGNGKFKPLDPISRQDLVTMFYRYTVQRISEMESTEYLLPAFKDFEKISGYATDAVNWALDYGIVEGNSVNSFDPTGMANRAQFAQILMNYAEVMAKTDVSSYRVTDTNYLGIRISGCRILNKKLYFHIDGMVNPFVLHLVVRFKLNGTCYEEKVELIPEYELNKSYMIDAKTLYSSDPANFGLKMDAVIEIEVQDSAGTLASKKMYCGEVYQQPSETPIYFKGEKVIDCRILLYHEFTEKAPAKNKYSVISTPRRLEENILYLLDAGYTIIPLDALIDYQNGTVALPEKCVVITLDDGYLSNYTMVYPLLKKYNIPATIFVTVCNMGVDAYKMTWEQMREMEASGLVNIQSHSWMHVYHNSIPDDELRIYVGRSFDTIEANLGPRTRRLFAYPHGKYTKNTIAILKEFNVMMQMTTEGKPLNMDHLDFSRLSRITVSYDSDMNRLMNIK